MPSYLPLLAIACIALVFFALNRWLVARIGSVGQLPDRVGLTTLLIAVVVSMRVSLFAGWSYGWRAALCFGIAAVAHLLTHWLSARDNNRGGQ